MRAIFRAGDVAWKNRAGQTGSPEFSDKILQAGSEILVSFILGPGNALSGKNNRGKIFVRELPQGGIVKTAGYKQLIIVGNRFSVNLQLPGNAPIGKALF